MLTRHLICLVFCVAYFGLGPTIATDQRSSSSQASNKIIKCNLFRIWCAPCMSTSTSTTTSASTSICAMPSSIWYRVSREEHTHTHTREERHPFAIDLHKQAGESSLSPTPKTGPDARALGVRRAAICSESIWSLMSRLAWRNHSSIPSTGF